MSDFAVPKYICIFKNIYSKLQSKFDIKKVAKFFLLLLYIEDFFRIILTKIVS
jgi:hypothetical protein